MLVVLYVAQSGYEKKKWDLSNSSKTAIVEAPALPKIWDTGVGTTQASALTITTWVLMLDIAPTFRHHKYTLKLRKTFK